jgi:hypothetical protein
VSNTLIRMMLRKGMGGIVVENLVSMKAVLARGGKSGRPRIFRAGSALLANTATRFGP